MSNRNFIIPAQHKARRTLAYALALIAIIIIALAVFFMKPAKKYEVSNSAGQPSSTASANAATSGPVSPISGQSCAQSNSRIMAVMISEDPQARPLSGLQDASMVFEMPVTPNGINRLMALYQCTLPSAIGSIRSAREDFVPLAQGMDAILAHWGGEEHVLAALNNHIIDNIDALPNPYNAFYRTTNVAPPENGFTSGSGLENAAQKLGYSLTNAFSGYPFLSVSDSSTDPNVVTKQNVQAIAIHYPDPYAVNYQYDSATNTYLRSRNHTPEIDHLTGKQVTADNVVVLHTTWTPWYSQYIRVTVIGSGTVQVFRNGKEIDGTWQKNSAAGKLYFFDASGKEIQFEPGNTWIEIVGQDVSVN